jgi:hypothetical protein
MAGEMIRVETKGRFGIFNSRCDGRKYRRSGHILLADRLLSFRYKVRQQGSPGNSFPS